MSSPAPPLMGDEARSPDPGASPDGGIPAAGTPPVPSRALNGDAAEVAGVLKLLARAVRAHQLYLPNNPVHARAIEALREPLSRLLTRLGQVELRVTEEDFLYDEVPVFTEGSRGAEGLPRLFYVDGIRSFQLRRGFEQEELLRFLDAVKGTRNRGVDDDDLVTLFWECDFSHMVYSHVEAGGEGVDAPGSHLLTGGAPVGQTAVRPDTETEVGVYGAGSSPFARMADFDSTLYFLEDPEIEYLRDAIEEDFSGDLRFSVVAALLDTFETQRDPAVREEICGILESFLVTLLAASQFSCARYLLAEAEASVSRVPDMLAAHRARVTDLVRHMSDPQVVTQILSALEETPTIPAEDDLVALLGQLNSQALAPVIAHLVRTQNASLRPLLELAASRVAASNTAELVMLLESADDAVALDAIRRAGALRIAPAVQPLTRLLESSNLEVRRSAAAALAEIATPGALQGLERGLEDQDRTVRVTAVLAMAQRQYRIALPRIERAVRGQVLRDGSGPEKAAFFEAYAMLGRDAAVPFLQGVLVPRGFLARKEDSPTRAAAATALGRLGSPAALEVLKQASAEKDVVVRTAAARALRGAV